MLDVNTITITGAFARAPKRYEGGESGTLALVRVIGVQDGQSFGLYASAVDTTAKLLLRFAQPRTLYTLTGSLIERADLHGKPLNMRLNTIIQTDQTSEHLWEERDGLLHPNPAHIHLLIGGYVLKDSVPSDHPQFPYLSTIQSTHRAGHQHFKVLSHKAMYQGAHATIHGTLRRSELEPGHTIEAHDFTLGHDPFRKDDV